MFKNILLFLFVLISFPSLAQVSIEKMLCDYNENPMGLDNKNPGLSWVIHSKGRSVKQTAYRILVAGDSLSLQLNLGNIWDSKKVFSDQSVQVEFTGEELVAAKKYYWKVMVWDNYGHVSKWSKISGWQMGLLAKEDWQRAKWIAYNKMPDSSIMVPALANPDDKRWDRGSDTLPILCKEFNIRKPVKSAVMFITGLGQFELSINGEKTGDHFLDPGWTKYDQHALYVTFDVTKQLQNGNNAIGVMLGNGFYFIPGERYHKLKSQFGYPKMICRLVITYMDGSGDNIVSDGSWKAAPGPVTFSSIYGGEDYDANKELPGWKTPGFDDSSWKNAIIADGPPQLDAQVENPLKIVETFSPKKITEPRPGVFVYDMGQNASGIPAITVEGRKGATLTITPAELLDSAGLVTQDAIGAPVYFKYTLNGNGAENWHPQFMYYGFRYIQVEGGVPVGDANGKGLPVVVSVKTLHTRNAAQKTGSFYCSNQLFNQTFHLIDWAVQNNMASIFTDCPHREKLGWLEETHLMGNSIQYNYDLATLFHKVVRDMMHSQTADGLVPDIAPEYVQFDEGFRDSPEWGSSAILLPYDIYKWYGDKKLLAESYPMMKRYIAYLNGKATGHLLNYGLGDWYDIGPRPPGYSQLTPSGITATAIFYGDLKIMQQAAHLLGAYSDETSYNVLAAQVKKAYNDKFFNKSTCQYGTGSQTANAISIFYGLADDEVKQKVLQNMVTDIRKHHNGVTSGDIGFRYLLKALSDEGRSDVIFDMNSRSDVPGYGYQLSKGATALTESWQGSRNSSNDHFMLGHLMEWFYSGLAGINQAANCVAYRQIIIKPQLPGNITYASASYLSPYGTIKNNWRKQNGVFRMQTDIPVNSTATLYLPSSKNAVITEGGKNINQVPGVKVTGYVDGRTVLKVGSGHYSFAVKQ